MLNGAHWVIVDSDRQSHIPFPAGRRLLRTDDVDHAREHLTQYLAPHRMEPLARDRRVHVVHHYLSIGAVGVGSLSYGGAVEIDVNAMEESALVELPLQGRLWARSGGQEIAANPRRGFVVNPTDRLWKRWQTTTTVLYVHLDRGTLRDRAELLAGRTVRGPLHFDTTFDPTDGADRTWLAHVGALMHHLPDANGHAAAVDPDWAAEWSERLIDEFLLGHVSSHHQLLMRDGEPLASRRTLRNLLEHIHAHPERPWTTAKMALTAGVGVRAIQKRFSHELDSTPRDYVRRLRLARAHALLLASDPATTTVEEIAARSGFMDPSRFASYYRARYGRSPVETLHRK